MVAMADEIEWGAQPVSAQAERGGWLGRLTAAPDEPAGPFRPARQRSKINYVALGLAIAGFLGILAGHYLPWVHFDLTQSVDPGTVAGGTEDLARTYDFSIGVVNSWEDIAYELSVLFSLALVATVLLAAASLRRALSGAALGMLAGQLAVLVGVSSAVYQGAGLGSAIQFSSEGDEMSVGAGFVIATVGCLLLAAAVIVNLREPRPARTNEVKAIADEPIDLVVTPLPGVTVDIRSESVQGSG
jgi:hypothetical protein